MARRRGYVTGVPLTPLDRDATDQRGFPYGESGKLLASSGSVP